MVKPTYKEIFGLIHRSMLTIVDVLKKALLSYDISLG